jgi:hypothetical protein
MSLFWQKGASKVAPKTAADKPCSGIEPHQRLFFLGVVEESGCSCRNLCRRFFRPVCLARQKPSDLGQRAMSRLILHVLFIYGAPPRKRSKRIILFLRIAAFLLAIAICSSTYRRPQDWEHRPRLWPRCSMTRSDCHRGRRGTYRLALPNTSTL